MTQSKSGTSCVCGEALPIHLAEIGLTAHSCSCERHYKVKDGKFIFDGTAKNPFAQWDQIQKKKR